MRVDQNFILPHRNASPSGDLLTVETPDTVDGDDESSESILHCLLKKSSANVNYQDNYGSTPLHYAASKGNPRSVEELLKIGKADVNVSWFILDCPNSFLNCSPYRGPVRPCKGKCLVLTCVTTWRQSTWTKTKLTVLSRGPKLFSKRF